MPFNMHFNKITKSFTILSNVILQSYKVRLSQFYKETVVKVIQDTLEEISNETTCSFHNIPSSFRAVTIVNIIYHVSSYSTVFL